MSEPKRVSKPTLSIVVIFHNMTREAERTLYTLSCNYQPGLSAADYEVLAIDNGSTRPLDPERVAALGANFRYRFLETESVSPAGAINFGARATSGEFVACIVDGARMVTPGTIDLTVKALRAFTDPFVCALAWHLGPKVQRLAAADGYDQSAEDRLLDSVDWRADGYRLFEISTLAPSSGMGILGGMPRECSWFAMPRSAFIEMGGYDERFQSPGGGLVNHDFLKRAMARPTVSPVVLLGEGTFHQIHRAATDSKAWGSRKPQFAEEYRRIYGRPYKRTPPPPPFYLGKIPPAALRFVNGAIK